MSLNDRILKSHSHSSNLLSSLSSTYAECTAHPLTKERISSLQQQLEDMKIQLQLLHNSTTREYKEFKDLDKSHVRRGFSKMTHRTDKWDASKGKEEREWREAWEKEEAYKAEVAQLEEEIRRTEQERDRTAEGSRQHNEKQVELDNLYNYTFAGPTPEYAEHEHARANYDGATAAFNDAQRLTDNANRVVKCLGDADAHFKEAQRQMGNAKDMSNMDMWVGGAMISATKREDMNRAQQSLMMAERSVFEAHTLDPEVVMMGQLSLGAQGSGFTDIWFDNIFTDIRVNDEIKTSIVKLKKLYDDNTVNLQGAKRRLEEKRSNLKAAASSRDDARWELQRVRAGIYDRVANGGGSNNASFGAPSSGNLYKPPPAYSGVA